MKPLVPLAALLLAACGAATPGPRSAGSVPVLPVAGLDRVMGQDAAALARLFGPADAEVREGPGRKLQFAGPICVLDAYLYPAGSTPPRVTWVDAREPDGSPIDRASCVAALSRRGAAR